MSTLVTAYKPYQGRGVNGSSTILRWLRLHWPVGQFHSRILPVAWEKAPVILEKLLQRHRPRRYLGLGEGQPGRCAWESVARNHQQGTDESGLHRAPSPICPHSEPQRHSTWPAPPHDVARILPNIPLVLSTDAGGFLCNHVLWTALGPQPANSLTQVAFLHLPPQESTSDRDYIERLGPFVLAVLRG